MRIGVLVLLSALAMSVGWGFRGDYGHEAGAMVPGALLALAVCLTSGREDWLRRGPILAMLGAVGWAFGGQMSYGLIVGYTAKLAFADVAYGYACLFVVGALWGGIGAGILALGVTRPRLELERFGWPLVAIYATWCALNLSGASEWLTERWSLCDTDWVPATAAVLVAAVCAWLVPQSRAACRFVLLLACGWLAGVGLLVGLLGLRMTPPRSDNWAGCVGLCSVMIYHLARTRNRAGLLLVLYGLLAGGIGFTAGDFAQMLGRAQWGVIGSCEFLQGLDYWKWMEQLFGFVMGGGVALGFARLERGNLAPPAHDSQGPLRYLAPVFLLVVMMWENLFKNVRTWVKGGHIKEGLFGLEPSWWFLIVGLLLTAMLLLALRQHARGRLPLLPANNFGRVQMLFFVILWVAVLAAFMQAFPAMKTKGVLFVHTSFWTTAALASMMVLALRGEVRDSMPAPVAAPESTVWLPGRRLALFCALVPLWPVFLAWLTLSMRQ